MNELIKIGDQTLPSVLSDPFLKTCITEIKVIYGKGLFIDNWSARGYVDFKNGNTKGEQKFEGETFDEVVIKIKAFIEELKNQ